MKYQKLSRLEKKNQDRLKMQNAMAGAGLYLYENNTLADMTLPRPTKSGRRQLGPKGSAEGQFQGDDYYMQMVRNGELRLLKVLQTPEQEESTLLKEQNMAEEKLILDQPDTVTEKGKVEHVVDDQTPTQHLRERNDDQPEDVLLNEGPVDDGFVIVEDE